MGSSRIAAWALLLAAVAAPTGVRGQEPDEVIGGLSFQQEVRVTVVNVDVYVRDRDGEPVTGLEADDFRILKNGVEVPISNFDTLDEETIRSVWQLQQGEAPDPAAVPPPPDADLPEVEPIWVILYVDNENIHPFHRKRVMRRVREFVIDNLAEPVRMMVINYNRSFEVVQPFTTDSRAVTSALREMATTTGGRVERDNARLDLVEKIADVDAQDYGSSGRSTREGGAFRLEQEIMSYAEEEANSLNFTLSALTQAIGMLSGLEGRKSIVYVSSGLPMTPGIGLMHQYATTFHDNSILSRRSRVDKTRAYRSLTTAANGQDVMLYTIDASGLNPLEGFGVESRYGMDPTASSIGSSDYQSSLRYMAAATGGLAVVNTNDIGPGLQRIRDDLFSYYSIGFTIDSAEEDRVHTIEVEIPGRSDLDVRYRKSFVEKSAESQVQDRVYSALMVDVVDNPMDLRIETRRPTPAVSDTWNVPIHLSFPLASVALLPEGEDYVGRLVLFLGARDADGASSEIQRQLHEVRVSQAEYEEATSQRFGIDVRLLLEEGRQRISVGLMDEITREDSFQQLTLRVP